MCGKSFPLKLLSQAIDSQSCVNKKSTFLEINFKVDGKVTIPCDVSTELFEHEIKNENNLIVKFGSSDYESDDILVIPEGSYQINVAQHIYETIVLSLPLKKIHPGIKNGTLKSDILEKLKALEPKKLFKLVIDRHKIRQSINNKKYLEI